MKYIAVTYLLLFPELSLGTPYAIVNRKVGSAGIQKRSAKVNIESGLGLITIEDQKILKVADNNIKTAGNTKGVNVFENSVKATGNRAVETAEESVKIAGQDIRDTHENFQRTSLSPDKRDDRHPDVFEDFSQFILACAEKDCSKNLYMNEAMRWIMQAIKDIVEFVRENYIFILLFIGSVFLAEFIGSSISTLFILKHIGFGPKGPIKYSCASNIQRIINPVKSGSLFSRLQSTAMRGAVIPEIKALIHLVITKFIRIGFASIIAFGFASNNYTNSTREWREWLLNSKVEVLSDIPSGADRFWGTPVYRGCVAYGYQEVHASLLFVPESVEPLTSCTQTPNLIGGIGYKSPLRCVGEGFGQDIVGIWYIPTATRCMPKWAEFENEGCMLYGYRRKFARLMGLAKNDDWRSMCESTPAIIDGKNYSHPSHCDDKGVLGIYGVFDLMDKDCECSCGPTQLWLT